MNNHNIDLEKIKVDYDIAGDIWYWVRELGYYKTLNNSSDLNSIDIEQMRIGKIVPYEVEPTYIFDIFYYALGVTDDILEEARMLLDEWSLKKGLTRIQSVGRIDLNKYLK